MATIEGITAGAWAIDIKEYYRALNSRAAFSSDVVVGMLVG
jgi:hypothetical protein